VSVLAFSVVKSMGLLLQASQAQSSMSRFEPTLLNFMMLSFLLFVIGVAGVLSRRNIIIIFMSI